MNILNNSRHPNETSRNKVWLTRTILALGLAGLSACGMTNESRNVNDLDAKVHIGEAFVYPGAYFRYDPFRVENSADGDSNHCAKPDDAVVIQPTDAWESKGDGNGHYIGFLINTLPEIISDNAKCKKDADGMIWVAEKNLNAPPITPISTDPR